MLKVCCVIDDQELINDLTDGSSTSIIIPIGSLYIPTPATADTDD